MPDWEVCGNGPLSARGRVDKALDQQETALSVFLDIEGTFDTSYDSMCSALARHGVDHTILRYLSHAGGSAGHGGFRGFIQERRGVQGLPAGRDSITHLMVPCK